MSSSSDPNADGSDAKLATESAPAGMNSITNTVGMQPVSNEASSPVISSNSRSSGGGGSGSCDHPGCTAEHSGKQHE